MKKLLMALASLAIMASVQTAYSADASGCEAKAMSKEGKPLAGAAKASFMKKCEKDAMGAAAPDAKAGCEAKAVSKDGKALHGAAKAASMKKCMGGAK